MIFALFITLGCFQAEALRLHRESVASVTVQTGTEGDTIVVNPRQKDDGSPNIVVGIVSVGENAPMGKYVKGQYENGWVQPIFERNLNIVKMHGHGLHIRELKSIEPRPFQMHEKLTSKQAKIIQSANANFEKFAFMGKCLRTPGVTHALIMDQDVVLVQTQIDSLTQMAKDLDASGKDIFFTNEDWHVNGTKLNGGMLFAKATDYSIRFFEEQFMSAQEGCVNDQICLNRMFEKNTFELTDHAIVKSGLNYNFAPQVWFKRQSGRYPVNPKMHQRFFDDPSLHLIHFMGVYKNIAQKILANLPPIPESVGLNKFFKAQTDEGLSMNCNDGMQATQCLDVDECASLAPSNSQRFALVVTHDLQREVHLPFPNMDSMLYQAKLHSLDVILMVPANATNPLKDEQKQKLAEQNIKIVEAPWKVPPNAKFNKGKNWCGPKDFIRLNIFSLTEYDAVAYYDTDVELQGDVTQALRCASRGYALTTQGPYAPLNLGFIAVKPSSALFETAVAFSEAADYDEEKGWDNAGWAPNNQHFVGGECGQGFLHTLLYKKNSAAAQMAFKKTGLQIVAKQLDPCVWNYQNRCPAVHFDCSNVRAHHKGVHGGCLKYATDLHYSPFKATPQ